MKKIFSLLLLLYPVLSMAQKPSAILHIGKDTLSKEGNILLDYDWKFHAGDDTLWAAKEYNDTGWKDKVRPYINMENGNDKKIGFTGVGWFRYRFYADSSLTKMPLAFQMLQSGAASIYLDGKLLDQYGEFSTKGKYEYINPKKRPLIFLIPDSGEHVLAVRFENKNAVARYKKIDEPMGGFELYISDVNYAIGIYNSNIHSAIAICVTTGCIFLALFFVHFILFMFYRADKSNLYFSLFNLGIASFVLLAFLGIIAQGVKFEDFLTPWIYISLSLACLSISMFVNTLFGSSKIRSKIIMILCLAEMILAFIQYVYASYFMLFIAIVCALEAVILLSKAMYRKVAGSRIIGTGILFFVIFFTIVTIAVLIMGEITLSGGILSIVLMLLSILAVFSIPLSMSAYLAWNFATVNKKLSLQLIQVEELSQKNLQQEQEKQQLLEVRKEELEKEVALRTSEVVIQKQQIEQQHEELKLEKKKSDDLLLNILPEEVAQELKEKGEAAAHQYDEVSVLFTDFVNFTQMSERMSPQELVAQLHENFKVFDEIIERNGLEKIKTIGDAYLAVSGMPLANKQHAGNAVRAGLEIAAYIKSRQKNNSFEVRIGIHSGPLVAGIVGVKKFAYDIWGDTVNTAARMESSSEAGKVNISESTYALVKTEFIFTNRGKIDAKHKGEMEMYFVDGAI